MYHFDITLQVFLRSTLRVIAGYDATTCYEILATSYELRVRALFEINIISTHSGFRVVIRWRFISVGYKMYSGG